MFVLEATFPLTSAIASDAVRMSFRRGSDVVWTWFGGGSDVGRRWLGRVWDLVQRVRQKLRESGFQQMFDFIVLIPQNSG